MIASLVKLMTLIAPFLITMMEIVIEVAVEADIPFFVL